MFRIEQLLDLILEIQMVQSDFVRYRFLLQDLVELRLCAIDESAILSIYVAGQGSSELQ